MMDIMLNRGNGGLSGWHDRRRGLVIAGAATAGVAALALSQHWLAAADLLPLLYVLPCAAMMLMCMKGSGNGRQATAATAAPPNEPPTLTDVSN